MTHPSVNKIHELRCSGMGKALTEQLGSPEVEHLSFGERLALLVDRELAKRTSHQLTNRLRRARLNHEACIEDVNLRHRGHSAFVPARAEIAYDTMERPRMHALFINFQCILRLFKVLTT